jgi:hypothetical protein
MLGFYLDFFCAVNYSIHVRYCNATAGVNYKLWTITNFEFPKTEHNMCVTKYIAATKTEVNICNIRVRSIRVRLCPVSHFQQHICFMLVCYKNEFTPTHMHTSLWTVHCKDLISSLLPFHITVMNNNLVVLQTKLGSFQRTINSECKIFKI